MWSRFGVTIDADPHEQLILNLHLFHLLQSYSTHTAQLDAGVPARGLHGEGYFGHVFWDEVFVLPVLGIRLPELGAAIVEYRWRRLPAALQRARQAGLPGAMFPWQSGSSGREETPNRIHNPRSGAWMPDNSHLQRHVGLAVGWNVWRHFQITADRSWLVARGAPLIIEIVRSFVALATFDPDDGRYHLCGVMGPDEFHDGYPDAPGRGLRDNAYTNVMLSWLCGRAAEALDVLDGSDRKAVLEQLAVTDDELAVWQRLSRLLAVPFHGDAVISQFDGYSALAELDWDAYHEKYGNIGRLDLILAAEGDSTNRYQASKQADVLMLFYLLGEDGLRHQLAHLGYHVTQEDLERTVSYYARRTAHGSTLSRVVHAEVFARFDVPRAWEFFSDALVADLDDTQWGTTEQGIHLGAMAGTVGIITRGFAGLRPVGYALMFQPRLPPRVRRLGFQVCYRGHLMDVRLTHETLCVSLHASAVTPIRVGAGDEVVTLTGGTGHAFELGAASET